jgi:hypothetical protein
MAQTYGQDAPTSSGFLTDADEMSLAQSRALQTSTSIADTLEVRGDSLTILHDQLEPWRRPARLALAAMAIGLGAIIGGGLVTRWREHTS